MTRGCVFRFKNVVFGGEGLFLTTLTGPGTVFLQSMPFDRIVDQVAKRVPGGGGLALGVPLGEGGGKFHAYTYMDRCRPPPPGLTWSGCGVWLAGGMGGGGEGGGGEATEGGGEGEDSSQSSAGSNAAMGAAGA